MACRRLQDPCAHLAIATSSPLTYPQVCSHLNNLLVLEYNLVIAFLFPEVIQESRVKLSRRAFPSLLPKKPLLIFEHEGTSSEKPSYTPSSRSEVIVLFPVCVSVEIYKT